MGGVEMETPRGWQADAGQTNRSFNLAGNETVPRIKGTRHSVASTYRVDPADGGVFPQGQGPRPVGAGAAA
jgi:hypothetical protein